MQSNPDNSHDFADSLEEVRDERNLCCTGPPQQALYGFVLPLTVSAQSTRYLLIGLTARIAYPINSVLVV